MGSGPLPATAQPQPTAQADLADTCCECRRTTGETDCIVCDQCGVGMHILCLNPPVAPPGDWFCPPCVFRFDDASTAEDYEKWLETHQLRNLVGKAGAYKDGGTLHFGRFIFPTPREYAEAQAGAQEGKTVGIGVDSPYWFKYDKAWPYKDVAQGLQTPPDTPNRVWRPSGVAQGLHTASRHLQTPQIELRSSGVAQVRAEARRGRQGPGRRSKGPGALSTPRGRDLGSPIVLG